MKKITNHTYRYIERFRTQGIKIIKALKLALLTGIAETVKTLPETMKKTLHKVLAKSNKQFLYSADQTINCDDPLTAKPLQSRMGKGKANIKSFVALIKKGCSTFFINLTKKKGKLETSLVTQLKKQKPAYRLFSQNNYQHIEKRKSLTLFKSLQTKTIETVKRFANNLLTFNLCTFEWYDPIILELTLWLVDIIVDYLKSSNSTADLPAPKISKIINQEIDKPADKNIVIKLYEKILKKLCYNKQVQNEYLNQDNSENKPIETMSQLLFVFVKNKVKFILQEKANNLFDLLKKTANNLFDLLKKTTNNLFNLLDECFSGKFFIIFSQKLLYYFSITKTASNYVELQQISQILSILLLPFSFLIFKTIIKIISVITSQKILAMTQLVKIVVNFNKYLTEIEDFWHKKSDKNIKNILLFSTNKFFFKNITKPTTISRRKISYKTLNKIQEHVLFPNVITPIKNIFKHFKPQFTVSQICTEEKALDFYIKRLLKNKQPYKIPVQSLNNTNKNTKKNCITQLHKSKKFFVKDFRKKVYTTQEIYTLANIRFSKATKKGFILWRKVKEFLKELSIKFLQQSHSYNYITKLLKNAFCNYLFYIITNKISAVFQKNLLKKNKKALNPLISQIITNLVTSDINRDIYLYKQKIRQSRNKTIYNNNKLVKINKYLKLQNHKIITWSNNNILLLKKCLIILNEQITSYSTINKATRIEDLLKLKFSMHQEKIRALEQTLKKSSFTEEEIIKYYTYHMVHIRIDIRFKRIDMLLYRNYAKLYYYITKVQLYLSQIYLINVPTISKHKFYQEAYIIWRESFLKKQTKFIEPHYQSPVLPYYDFVCYFSEYENMRFIDTEEEFISTPLCQLDYFLLDNGAKWLLINVSYRFFKTMSVTEVYRYNMAWKAYRKRAEKDNFNKEAIFYWIMENKVLYFFRVYFQNSPMIDYYYPLRYDPRELAYGVESSLGLHLWYSDTILYRYDYLAYYQEFIVEYYEESDVFDEETIDNNDYLLDEELENEPTMDAAYVVEIILEEPTEENPNELLFPDYEDEIEDDNYEYIEDFGLMTTQEPDFDTFEEREQPEKLLDNKYFHIIDSGDDLWSLTEIRPYRNRIYQTTFPISHAKYEARQKAYEMMGVRYRAYVQELISTPNIKKRKKAIKMLEKNRKYFITIKPKIIHSDNEIEEDLKEEEDYEAFFTLDLTKFPHEQCLFNKYGQVIGYKKIIPAEKQVIFFNRYRKIIGYRKVDLNTKEFLYYNEEGTLLYKKPIKIIKKKS